MARLERNPLSQQSLLEKIERVLKSKECSAVRFQLENIRIQTYMYSFIVQPIRAGRINVRVGSGSGYDDTVTPHTIIYPSDNPEGRTIVHEATHAVIDTTHKGQKLSKGSNEAAAYIAEAVYGLYTQETMGFGPPPQLARPIAQEAQRIHEFNSKNRSGLYVVPSDTVMYISTILRTAKSNYGNVDSVETMKGIGAPWS